VKAALLTLLAAADALAAAAWLDCGSCASPALAIAGTAFYTAAFAAVALFGPTRAVALALYAAFGFHAGLVAGGEACALCWATAACSLAMAVLLARSHGAALAVAPWTAAVALSLAPAPAPGADVTVYERPDCPYCEELRASVMPEATRGLDVRVYWRPATPAVRATPTIVVGRRIFEGVPPADLLRRAIQEAIK